MDRGDIVELLTLPALLAVLLLTLNVGLVIVFDLATGRLRSPFFDIADMSLFEFALLMILGGCLMARQPLEDEKRYDEQGRPVTGWVLYQIGRELLLIGLFILLYGAVILFASLLV